MSQYIKIKEFAALLGVSVQATDNWRVSRGFSECIEEGKGVNLLKASRWLYQWKEELSQTKSDLDSNSEKKYWDAQKAKIQVRLLLEELIPKTEYIATERERFLIFKDSILFLEEKLAKEFTLDNAEKKNLKQILKSILLNVKNTFEGRVEDWEEWINSSIEIPEYTEGVGHDN